MQTRLFLFLSLLCTLQICDAQAYMPFLREGAHWSISERYCDGNCDPAYPDPNACIVVNDYSFKLSHDSSLAPDEMYLVETRYSTTHTLGGTSSCYSSHAQNGAFTSCHNKATLREDTAARKVYFKIGSGWGTNGSVFFDFSKNVGDTLKFISKDFYRTIETFYIVDSIFVSHWGPWGNGDRKTWALRPVSNGLVYEMYLYESIGMNVGFWGYQRFEGDYSTHLINYCIGTDSTCRFSCLNPTLGINKLSNNAFIALYPNPAKDLINLTIQNSSPSETLHFTISDLLGRTVQTQAITQTQTEFEISSLPKGIYLWHLVSDGVAARSGKIIKE